jgi:hypothetical protein
MEHEEAVATFSMKRIGDGRGWQMRGDSEEEIEER